MGTKYSEFPSAMSVGAADSIVGLQDETNKRFQFSVVLSFIERFFVPNSRKINNKSLSSDITLDASDVGAVDTADVGVADGVASLDSNGKVPGTQLDLSGKQDEITANGILKGDGQGGVSAATAGTDYQAPLTAGTDYATPTQLADKANQTQLAYVETGTTASQNYAIGQYISLNGLLYTADTAIANGATFYTSGGNKNLTACVGGGFNASIVPVDDSTSITYDSTYIDDLQVHALRTGKLCVVQLSIKFKSIRVPGHTALINNLQPAKVDLLPRFFGNDGSYIKLYIAAGETSIKKDEGQNISGTWYNGTLVYFRT